MAESMPLNKSMTMGSNILPDIYCDPCHKGKGQILQAAGFCRDCSENLCPACVTTHKKYNFSLNHQLVDKPRALHKKQSGQEQKSGKCNQQEEEILLAYCRSCDQLCYNICQTVDHQSCDLQTFNIAADNIKDSHQLENKLKVLKKGFNDNLSKAKKQSIIVEKFYTDAIKEMRKLQEKFEKLLAKTEKQAQTLKDEDLKNMESISKTCNITVEQINNISSNLHEMQGITDSENYCISIKRAEIQLKSFEDCLIKLETDNTTLEYTFKPEKKLHIMLEELNMLGELSFFNRASAAPVFTSRSVQNLATECEFDECLKNNYLVVVEFTASWCGPCKKIEPKFEAMANDFANVKFVKVYQDKKSAGNGPSALPTFQFYIDGRKVDEFAGAYEDRLRAMIEMNAQ